jgi:hypothetical protein
MAAHETTGLLKNQPVVDCGLTVRALNFQPMVEQHDGDRLRILMDRSGTSDQDLAEATEASVQAVGKWKHTGQFARDRIVQICREVRCSADELLGLVPIDRIAETPAHYHAMLDRDRLQVAVRVVEQGLARADGVILAPEGKAELIMAIYDRLQIDAAEKDVLAFLSRILKVFAHREE